MTDRTDTCPTTSPPAHLTAPVTEEGAAPAPAPAPDAVDQDAETIWVHLATGREQVRLHDYKRLFAVPGLYETVFDEMLGCDSPRVVVDELAAALNVAGVDPSTLRAVDLGAGNGMVGERLAALGVVDVIGIDRLPDAAHAAYRDRPGLYRDYLVADVTDLTVDDVCAEVPPTGPPNLLTCVAALGFGDIEVPAFTAAVGLLSPGSWIAFNIKSAFLEFDDPTGFATFLAEQIMFGQLRIVREQTYLHRRSVAGEALHYTSIIARTS